jgi:hypothetical protein
MLLTAGGTWGTTTLVELLALTIRFFQGPAE